MSKYVWSYSVHAMMTSESCCSIFATEKLAKATMQKSLEEIVSWYGDSGYERVVYGDDGEEFNTLDIAKAVDAGEVWMDIGSDMYTCIIERQPIIEEV